MFGHSREVGQGAAVYWQDRLWVVTYSPHAAAGSDDKLYVIDRDLKMESFEGSVGGTPAFRSVA